MYEDIGKNIKEKKYLYVINTSRIILQLGNTKISRSGIRLHISGFGVKKFRGGGHIPLPTYKIEGSPQIKSQEPHLGDRMGGGGIGRQIVGHKYNGVMLDGWPPSGALLSTTLKYFKLLVT